MKVLGNVQEGLVFVISAPSGTGKTTLVQKLTQENPKMIESVSSTTRPPREGEVNGREYYFLSEEEFKEKIDEDAFLEYALVFGNYYGTLKEHVVERQKEGKHVFLVIDTQGVMQLKEHGFPAIYIFLSPPSINELEKRLRSRRTETEALIEKRLSWAQQEMEQVPHYDYHIINETLENAYTALRSIVIAEEHRVRR